MHSSIVAAVAGEGQRFPQPREWRGARSRPGEGREVGRVAGCSVETSQGSVGVVLREIWEEEE